MSRNPIPYGRQNISDEDIEAVISALKSDYLTQGPRISQFEKAFAEYVGSRYAVAVSNGTAALHLSAMALDTKPGQRVITTPITFAASANAVKYCGGDIVFADINPETYLIDFAAIRTLLEAASDGTYAGIIPVDFAGRAVDLESLRSLADEFGLWIIEDACHAPGGSFINSEGNHQYCGNGHYADLSIFSFHPVKHIAAGEGGMVTTNNEELYKRLVELRTHGITRDKSKYSNPPELANGSENSGYSDYPGWYMEMQELGFNYRLTDFQAALGQSQLSRANAGIQKRRAIARKYKKAFADIAQITDRNFESESDPGHAFHLYVIEAEKRRALYEHLRKNNIFAQIHYIPLHLMPWYQKNQSVNRPGSLPNAESYYARCISLPMYPTLGEDEQDFVIDVIQEFYHG